MRKISIQIMNDLYVMYLLHDSTYNVNKLI